VEAQVAVAEQAETGSMAQQVAVAEQAELDKMLAIQQFKTELEAQDTLEVLVLVLEHQAEELGLITAGHLGLV
jgi:hypothetical protein